MNFKSVLTLLDNSHQCTTWARFAIELARLHEARLTGIAPREIASALTMGEMVAVSSAWVAELQQQIDANARQAIATFDQLCEAEIFNACESRVEDGTDVSVLRHNTNASDIIVIGQHVDGDTATSTTTGLIESLLMSSARPLMVVPAIGEYSPQPTRAMIAWRNSRESAMAVRMAIPQLALAREVEIVTVDNKACVASETQATLGLIHYLATHQITATHRHVISDVDAGNTLLSHACDSGANLLIMGGYGHARLREWALGGVTKTILQSMTLPVLMAH